MRKYEELEILIIDTISKVGEEKLKTEVTFNRTNQELCEALLLEGKQAGLLQALKLIKEIESNELKNQKEIARLWTAQAPSLSLEFEKSMEKVKDIFKDNPSAELYSNREAKEAGEAVKSILDKIDATREEEDLAWKIGVTVEELKAMKKLAKSSAVNSEEA